MIVIMQKKHHLFFSFRYMFGFVVCIVCEIKFCEFLFSAFVVSSRPFEFDNKHVWTLHNDQSRGLDEMHG